VNNFDAYYQNYRRSDSSDGCENASTLTEKMPFI